MQSFSPCRPLATLLLLLLALPLPGCRDRQPGGESATRQKAKLSVCMGGMVSVLPIIAQAQELDLREGISLSIQQRKDGKLAMDAAMAGECDFAINSEPPIVQLAFAQDDFVILAAVMASGNASKIIARQDRGITSADDLRGKRIGARRFILSHFFLGMYLQKHGIDANETEILFFESRELPQALAGGQIDAYASADTYIIQGKQLLGEKAVVLSEPDLCYNGSYLSARRAWVDANPDLVRRLLSALLAAEEYLREHPGQTKAMLAERLGLPAAEIEAIFADSRFEVSLPQPLLLSFEDQARWQIATGQTENGKQPNFLDFFRPEFLRELRPGAVTIKK